jgi:dTDP-4-amino-4,6-dideoxygalactose transaminase
MDFKVPFVDLKAQYKTIRNEMDATVLQVMESAQFVGGPWLDRFEKDFASYVGADHAIGTSSGTSAIELALKALKIGPGDDVIVPSNSFFATAEAVSNVGATPVFADVNADTFHLDIASAERVLTPRTRAVIPVHLYGWALDIAPIERFAKKHHLVIIEDAAQAHGVGRGGKRVGSSGRLTCFSFYPGKNLGAYGEAGAVTTNDAKLAELIRLYRDHGSPSKYRHSVVGTNGRLDSLQAAVLSVKLPHLDGWNRSRCQHAEQYARALKGSELVTPFIPSLGEHNFHLFVVRTPKRDQLRDFLTSQGIGCSIHYPIPLHLTEAYQDLGAPKAGSFPVAERLAGEILSLPMFPELTASQIDYTVSKIKEFFGVEQTSMEKQEIATGSR